MSTPQKGPLTRHDSRTTPDNRRYAWGGGGMPVRMLRAANDCYVRHAQAAEAWPGYVMAVMAAHLPQAGQSGGNCARECVPVVIRGEGSATESGARRRAPWRRTARASGLV